tara:strand:- start:1206 stop:1850 length:645 start_codon:yes stop_codon:yes gene_type:complete
MKILCVGYRDWAIKIYTNLIKKRKDKIFLHYTKSYLEKKILKINPDIILFYGWSWIIKEKVFKNYNCFMLHPSPLPKYRGGSPIQNQIIRGEKISAVTIFKINEIIDGGDIYFQKKISLIGSLNKIFEKIVIEGTNGTLKILNTKKIKIKKQNHNTATYFTRRKPEQSEITIKEIKEKPAEYIANKIRMLDDPYPNAFIRLKNKKLFIKKFKIK